VRPRFAVATAAISVPILLSPVLTGCSTGTGSGGTSAASGQSADTKAKGIGAVGRRNTPRTPSAEPRTPEEFLARAKDAMSGQKGWTFAVKGNEGLEYQGTRNTATYTATVRRTQSPMALHSTGTTYTKGVAKPEEIYVADGTGHVRKGGAGSQWKSGPLSDPEIANAVEDPVADLDAFRAYAQDRSSGTGVSVDTSAGQVRLKVTIASAALPTVRNRAVVKKAVRELTPTLDQLHAAGVTTTEDRITVQRVEEVFVLDPTTYRIRSHRSSCTFLIPYHGQNMRYGQDVTERTEGVFTGAVTRPTGVE
jgi:hypothetical protein